MEHEQYMRRALALAEQAAALGEVPVGAVIVRRSTGEIVGEGYNRREIDRHALAHAELMAIDAACRKLGGWRLPDCALYVTLEPCPMCSGAIIQARIDEVYFGASDPKSGAVRSVQQMFDLPYNYHPAVTEGLLREECSAMLTAFFRELRLQRRKKDNPEEKK
ncbi:MAG: tRNA adenosine(34) deaminase TadA [Oscillospiraceae bacterium]|nr:tRNA adenosine(34) deaminase TadA [Oscillospiraceae bacterium]